MCAGRESQTFPHILTQTRDRTTIPTLRSILQRNLDDELGNGNPNDAHFQHYLHLLDALEISRERFAAFHEGVGIRCALHLATQVAQHPNDAFVLGYLLINEAPTPITYAAAHAGLRQFYADCPAHFFELHVTVDAEHVRELMRASQVIPVAHLPSLLDGIALGERGMAVLLDEAYGWL